jgi:hypothetical protein
MRVRRTAVDTPTQTTRMYQFDVADELCGEVMMLFTLLPEPRDSAFGVCSVDRHSSQTKGADGQRISVNGSSHSLFKMLRTSRVMINTLLSCSG